MRMRAAFVRVLGGAALDGIDAVGLEHLLNDLEAVGKPGPGIFVLLHEHKCFIALADLLGPPFLVLAVSCVGFCGLDEVDETVDDDLEGLLEHFVVVDLLREGAEAGE